MGQHPTFQGIDAYTKLIRLPEFNKMLRDFGVLDRFEKALVSKFFVSMAVSRSGHAQIDFEAF